MRFLNIIGIAAAMTLSMALNGASAEDFYAGKSMKVVTGGSPAGGYDTHTRTLARQLGKHIPGKPNIIVQNMPGGSGIKSINHTFNKAKRDGTEIGQFNRNALFARLLGHKTALFNLDEFNWIGSTASYRDNAWVVIIRSELPYTSIKDLREAPKPVVFGNVRSVLIPITKEALGANIRIIEGYEGGQLNLAFERGEIDGMGTGYSNLFREHPNWLKDKKVRIMVQFGSGERIKALKDVPTAREVAVSQDDKDLVEFSELALTLGYPFAMPPGVPKERVEIVRKAFIAAVNDPAYLAEAKKAKLEVTPRFGDKLEAAVIKAAKAPQSLIARYKRLAGESGDKTR
jgi:tripartite-type tricarboxylate transporter receptor subunit TctC